MKNNFTGITANISLRKRDEKSMIIMGRTFPARVRDGQTDYLPANGHTNNNVSRVFNDPTNPAVAETWAATRITEIGKIYGMQYLGSLPDAGFFLVITYMHNGTATPLAVQISHTSTDIFGNGSQEDTDHSFTVRPGDLICLRWANDAGNSAMLGSVSCIFAPL